MHIINIQYTRPLVEIDAQLDAHVAFLNEQYALGNFHISGRKTPRRGGVIISTLDDRELLLKIIEEDPFKKHNLATYELIAFEPSKTSAEFEFLLSK